MWENFRVIFAREQISIFFAENMKKNEQPDCSLFLYIVDNLQQKNKNNVVATTSIEKIGAIL